MRRQWHRIKRRGRRGLIVVGALAVVTHPLWLGWIGGYLLVADPIVPADAIVPLAGDPSRVVYAANLFEQGYAYWFVATSMRLAAEDNHGQPFVTIVRRSAIRNGVPAQQIVIAPGVATTTVEEAVLLRQFVQQQGWHSLIVVTSPSHTRRARLILRDIFAGSGIALVVTPVMPHPYTDRSWWYSTTGWRETVLEYLKLAVYLSGYQTRDLARNER